MVDTEQQARPGADGHLFEEETRCISPDSFQVSEISETDYFQTLHQDIVRIQEQMRTLQDQLHIKQLELYNHPHWQWMQHAMMQQQNCGTGFSQAVEKQPARAGQQGTRPAVRRGGKKSSGLAWPPPSVPFERCDELRQMLSNDASEESVSKVIDFLTGKMKQLALDSKAGSQLVQRAMERIGDKNPITAKLITELHTHVDELAVSPNANYVLQHIIENMPTEHAEFIPKAMLRKVDVYACHHIACRVVCRCLEHSNSHTETMLDRLLAKGHVLCRDKFGHYVIESILGGPNKDQKLQQRVLEVLKRDIVHLVEDRSTSFVIMAALKECESEDAAKFAEHIFRECSRNLVSFAGSRVGARVVESLAAFPGVRGRILQILQDNRDDLSQHGTQLLSKLEKEE